MDDDFIAVRIFLGLIGIVILIVTIIVGGSFRTEVTYIPPGITKVSEQTSFEENLVARHWLFGLKKGQQPNLQKALAKYVRPGEQITKLTIITKHTWQDGLITGFTLLIYCPQTVTIKGTIARK